MTLVSKEQVLVVTCLLIASRHFLDAQLHQRSFDIYVKIDGMGWFSEIKVVKFWYQKGEGEGGYSIQKNYKEQKHYPNGFLNPND